MTITKLPSRHWHQLENIFNKEFDSDLPEVDSDAEIFLASERKERKGFILIEPVKFIGQIYTFNEKNDIKTALSMIRFVQSRYDGTPVATLASEPRFEKLFRSLGMEGLQGKLFRKN